MKTSLYLLFSTFFISLVFIHIGHAQEYDDIYFRKSDRQELVKLRNEEAHTYGKDSHLYDEIRKLEGNDEEEDVLSEYNEENQEEIIEQDPLVVEKHYYYNRNRTDYADRFWNDPYLYQGTIYDPYSYDYQSPYWRSRWSVSLTYGNRWNRSRYWADYRYGYYDPRWGSNSWYYDSYWCPPLYSGRGNVIVYSNRTPTREVVRSKRSSRNSSVDYRSRTTRRSDRIANTGTDKNIRNGRYGNRSSDAHRNTGRTYDRTGSSPRKKSYSDSGSNRRSNRSYYGNTGSSRSGTTNNRSGSTYRSRSKSSGSSEYRSSGSSRSSSSSSRSRSGSSSRSSRSKRD